MKKKQQKTKTFSITHLFLSSDWNNNRSKAVLQSIVVNTAPPPFSYDGTLPGTPRQNLDFGYGLFLQYR